MSIVEIERPDISYHLNSKSRFHIKPPYVLKYEKVYNFPKVFYAELESSTFFNRAKK